MDTVEELARKAANLEPSERLRLIEALIYGLDKPDSEIEQAWVAEAEARYEAYKRGELSAVDWEDIRKRYQP